jgi:hypothetical protein
MWEMPFQLHAMVSHAGYDLIRRLPIDSFLDHSANNQVVFCEKYNTVQSTKNYDILTPLACVSSGMFPPTLEK